MAPSFKKIFSPESDADNNSDPITSPYSSHSNDSINSVQEDDDRPAWMSNSPSNEPVVSSYAPPRTMTTVKNVLNSDVSVKGTLKFTDDLLIDGIVEGEISSQGTLTIGENAQVTAEIRTSSVVIHGKLHGNIYVTDRVEMKSTAEVIGDVRAATIAIEAGAVFVGRSEVGGSAPTISESPAKHKAVIASASAEETPSNQSDAGDDSMQLFS